MRLYIFSLVPIAMLWSALSHAQMWGAGMFPGQCPWEVAIGDSARELADEARQMRKDLKEAEDVLRDARKARDSAIKEWRDTEKKFKESITGKSYLAHGLEKFVGRFQGMVGTGNKLNEPENCNDFSKAQNFDNAQLEDANRALNTANKNFEVCARDQKCSGRDDLQNLKEAAEKAEITVLNMNKANENFAEKKDFPVTQFATAHCELNGRLKSEICSFFKDSSGAKIQPNNLRDCKDAIKEWPKKFQAVQRADQELREKEQNVKSLKGLIDGKIKDARGAAEEYQKRAAEGDTDACAGCAMIDGVLMSQRKPGTGEILGNVGMALGSMLIGSGLQRSQMSYNAQLGIATNSVSPFAFASPWLMGGIYGTLFGGGAGMGSWGCMGGGGPWGQMMGMNPYMMAMMSGMGGAGMGANMGGFNPMMMGGFNPMMMGGFNPMMMGGFNPMMMGGGWNMGGAIGGGIGFNMGGGWNMMGGGWNMMGGGGYPVGMGIPMMGGGWNMGGAIGGGIGFNMGGGWNMMGGGWNMMGGGWNMMGGGWNMGGAMGGGWNMGGAMGGAMGGMMPGMDQSLMQLQMQMQMMQAQMQQQQMVFEMQRRQMEAQARQAQVVSGLTMELQSVMMRLNQARMGMNSGGMLGFEGNFMGTGGINTGFGGSLGVPAGGGGVPNLQPAGGSSPVRF